MFKSICFLISLLFVSVSVSAENANNQSQHKQYHEVKISPDGKTIAVAMDVEGKRTLAFLNTANMEYVGGSKLPRLSEVGQFYWANNERVIIQVHKKEAWRPESIYYGELFAQNIDGTKANMIYGYRALHERKARGAGSKFKKKKRLEGSAEIINLMSDDERSILISSTLWKEGTHPSDTHWKGIGNRLAAVYKLDIYNGEISTKRIGGAPVSYATFLSDNKAQLKIAYGENVNNELYIMSDDGKWQQVASSNVGKNIQPLAINSAGTHMLALDNFNQQNTGLFQLRLSDGSYENLVSDDEINVLGAEVSKDGHDVYALLLSGDYPSYAVLNQDTVESQVFNNLLAVFPKKQISIVSKSDNNELFVVQVMVDGKNFKHYIYNKTTNKLSAFG
ncbi:hypothetical protein [Thalassotalea atypica]|uniref:hypothetical protein n=1 Tax=Thalassotalea atypica TaxID=2054316 RepID=UPI00257372C0|nr:hypothetical protein [Thalassotalea atypica]